VCEFTYGKAKTVLYSANQQESTLVECKKCRI